MPRTYEDANDIERFTTALRVDGAIDIYAYDSARDRLYQCFRFKRHPRHTPDQVYLDQAAELVASDLLHAANMPQPLTPEEQEHYRERFTAAYMRMFRDPVVYMAEWEAYKKQHPGSGIICVLIRGH